MLVKLLKYELRSTSRIILYIYAGILAAATLMGILGRFLSGRWETTDGMMIVFGAEDANSIVATLFLALSLIYFFLMAALCVLTIVMIIMRFYNNMLQGEGYLMHTLPVPTWELIASKLIVALIWNLIAVVVALISGLLIVGLSGAFTYMSQYVDVAAVIREVFADLNINSAVLILTSLFSVVATILQFYFCMSVGNLSSQHKLLTSVGAYVGIQIITSIVSAILGNNYISQLDSAAISMSPMLITGLISNIVLSVLFFFGTERLLSRHLNLA